MKRTNLINLRKEQGYTQLELAKKAGITDKHYQSLEAGTSKGSVDVWEKLKLILRAESIDWLLMQSGKNTLNK